MVLTYPEAKVWVRKYEKQLNKDLEEHQEKVNRHKRRKRRKWRLRVYHPSDVVRHRIYHKDHVNGRFTYTTVVNGEETGRIVVAMGPKEQPKIIYAYHITRKDLHKDLNCTERIRKA